MPPGSHRTINTIRSQYVDDANPQTIVVAESLPGDDYNDASGERAVILYYSADPAARAATYGFGIRSIAGLAVPLQAAGYTVTLDKAILIMFEWDSLAPGQSHTASYRTVLAAGNIDALIAVVTQPDSPSPPTVAPARDFLAFFFTIFGWSELLLSSFNAELRVLLRVLQLHTNPRGSGLS